MSVLRCSICGGHLLDCDCHLGEEPPADHLGERSPRPLYADEWPGQAVELIDPGPPIDLDDVT